jgi:hypothetical protein
VSNLTSASGGFGRNGYEKVQPEKKKTATESQSTPDEVAQGAALDRFEPLEGAAATPIQ